MPKRHRLRRTDAPGPARRLHGALFVLSVSPLGDKVRATCSVSKKVAQKAVARNLIKRRARAALAPLLKELPPGAYLLQAKRAAASASFQESATDIRALVKKAS